MNDQERSELERLMQGQQALQDRLSAWETRIHGELNRLQAARQDVEELQRQAGALREENRQLEALARSLQGRLEPVAAPAVSMPQPPVREAAKAPRAPEPSRATAPPPLPSSLKPAPMPAPLQMKPAAAAEPPVIGKSVEEAEPSEPKPVLAQVIEPAGVEAAPPVPEPVFAETSGSPPAERPMSFELRLGTYWAVRIGIVAILTGMVFLAKYAYQNYVGRLGPGGKVALLYLLSFGLLGLGAWLHRKQESLKNYARVLVAGGLAAVYFTTYAAHHVANLSVIPSAALDGALLLAWAGFIVWLADRLKSEVLALFATGLGYYTAVMTSVGSFTLYSNLVLTLASLFFLVRNRWALLSSISLGATYFAYAFWRFYHQGDWHWATPEEGLWKGAYFLMSYWVLFTAAAFLSKHEQSAGTKRATFATLNNGAFFALFLLTMLQVRTGGFWKLALGYGSALLVLAWLSAWLLKEEKVTSRAYLTQGLLLVTLGFIAHFSGLNLALMLAFESVALLVLGSLLNQPIMRFGAFVTAALSLVWAVPGLQAFDRRGLITGSVVGALMLFNAQWDRRRREDADSTLPLGVAFFTALAVFVLAFTTWRNVGDRWVAVAWAVESVLCLLASRPLGNLALRHSALPLAILGVGAVVSDLLGLSGPAPGWRTGLWPSALTGGLVVFNAWWSRRLLVSEDRQEISPAAAIFAGLGLLTWLAATWVFVPSEFLAPVLAAEAAVLTLAGLGLGTIEITAMAQGFLLLAQINCLAHLLPAEFMGNAGPLVRLPWWNPVSVLLVTLAISHGWQRWSLPAPLAGARHACQAIDALAAVCLLIFWLQPHFGPAAWLALTCGLALAVTAYGAVTRSWWLAGGGQLLLLVSLIEFARRVVFAADAARPVWFSALAPLVTFAVLPFLVSAWLARRPELRERAGGALGGVSLLYRVIAGLLAFAWVFEYVPARERFWALVLVGAGLFGWAVFRKSEGLLGASAVFTGVGFLVLWNQINHPGIVYVPNLLAILAVMAQQQAARRRADRVKLAEPAHSAVLLVAGCSLWLLVSRWVLQQAGGFYLTVAWAALALVIFTAGFLLRERMDRWLGLGVLGLALGRVVLYDLWKLETLHRILSFMALGVVLLVLGFLYSKYQEKIRQWL